MTVTLETPGLPAMRSVKDQFDASQNGTWVAGPAALQPDDAPREQFHPEASFVFRRSVLDHKRRGPLPRRHHHRNSGGGGSDILFVRQDVKHYSCDSIAELKNLWQVLPDATATVAGYFSPGDKGGGDSPSSVRRTEQGGITSRSTSRSATSLMSKGSLRSQRPAMDLVVLTASRLGHTSRASVAWLIVPIT